MIEHPTHLIGVFAQAVIGADRTRELTVYDLRRLGKFDDPRSLWLVAGGALIAFVLLTLWSYYRERKSISRSTRWILTALRVTALVALALYFLGPEKRSDSEVQTSSEVAILVDTSQSMSVRDESAIAESKSTRLEAIRQTLDESPLVASLRKNHNVHLHVFDEKREGVTIWPRSTQSPAEDEPEADTIDWQARLEPRGAETRVGNAIRDILDEERTGTLAGVIVLSDGGNNSGIEPLEIADQSSDRKLPIYTVGVGSEQPRRNLRIQELSAPSRVYPDDKATVSCLIQNEGFAGRSVEVELFLRDAAIEGSMGDRIASKTVTFSEHGEVLPIEFDFEPVETGRLAIEVKLVAPTGDQYAGDNVRQAEVEVVETDSRVLLIASGAARDYRFLRNQLRRDRHMRVDVWLQMAPSGISQDADQLLARFPGTKEELYAYDCIVAFDPDWTLLDAQQVDLLESWVAEEAGGLVVVAGPVHTASWVQSPEHIAVRSLYPVEFQKRLTLLDDGLYGSDTPWPLEFSRDGEDSDFLWLGDNADESQLLWSEFDGVYGCYAVKGPKPGARVLARYSDPDAGISAQRPVYLAEHFYGAGRVVYLGSSELWRLRSLSVEYFEVLYTQLIRHVSQGRLLRGSSLGRLLVPKDRYTVGDDVVVRAQLSSESREPLVADRVTARVVSPDGAGRNLTMSADPDRAGNFVGQFSVRQEGSYRIELPVPDVIDEQLVHRLQVSAPNLEFDRTRRNGELLAAIATRSGGQYYKSLTSAAEGSENLRPLGELIENCSETRLLRGSPDAKFTEWLNRILLGVIATALSAEWIVRRLMKLA
ncbi:MAG: hypothetical protein AAGD11_06735 [Planctomycetota bacterium]